MSRAILFGVFGEELTKLSYWTYSDTYPFRSWMLKSKRLDKKDCPENEVLRTGYLAAHTCYKINFSLDNLDFPYMPEEGVEKPLTFSELELVINTPELLSKTQFWLCGEEIETGLALNLINTPCERPLSYTDVRYLFKSSRLNERLHLHFSNPITKYQKP